MNWARGGVVAETPSFPAEAGTELKAEPESLMAGAGRRCWRSEVMMDAEDDVLW